MSLNYLSFANKEWLGACIIEAESIEVALTLAWLLDINPGGTVFHLDLSSKGIEIEERFMNRLLDKDDLVELDKAVGGSGETVKIIR